MAAMAKEHWKQYYPEHYQVMVRKGMLEQEAEAAAKLTRREMDVNKLVGMTEQEAWEAAREIFILAQPDRSWLRDED